MLTSPPRSTIRRLPPIVTVPPGCWSMSTVTPWALARAAGRCASPAPMPARAAAVTATAADAIISIGVQRVVDPFLAHAADAVVDGLRALVVGRCLPLE